MARDAVRLLVARRGGVSHARFADLADYLRPGDLLVVNNSAPLPAAVDGRRGGRPIAVHFSTARAEKVWVVELRPAGNPTGHLPDVRPGERIDLPGGAAVVIRPSYPGPGVKGARLWVARVIVEGPVGHTSPGTAGRSGIHTCRDNGRFTITRRCSPGGPAAPKCPVLHGHSLPNW